MGFLETFTAGSPTIYVVVLSGLSSRVLLPVRIQLPLECHRVAYWVPICLLFINDLSDAIPESTSSGLYADDTKLYEAIRCMGDCTELQRAMSCAADTWSKEHHTSQDTIPYPYHLGPTDIKCVEQEIDL